MVAHRHALIVAKTHCQAESLAARCRGNFTDRLTVWWVIMALGSKPLGHKTQHLSSPCWIRICDHLLHQAQDRLRVTASCTAFCLCSDLGRSGRRQRYEKATQERATR
jgi:hypothetical protein